MYLPTGSLQLVSAGSSTLLDMSHLLRQRLEIHKSFLTLHQVLLPIGYIEFKLFCYESPLLSVYLWPAPFSSGSWKYLIASCPLFLKRAFVAQWFINFPIDMTQSLYPFIIQKLLFPGTPTRGVTLGGDEAQPCTVRRASLLHFPYCLVYLPGLGSHLTEHSSIPREERNTFKLSSSSPISLLTPV